MIKNSRHSEETKQKLKKAWETRPRQFSEVTKKRMSNFHKGHHRGGWRKENPISTYERKLWLNNKRRVRKLENGGSHTEGEWQVLKAQYNWTCPSCKKEEPEIKLSRDHIIPLMCSGSDNIENIQPLCKSCNSKKHDKETKYDF